MSVVGPVAIGRFPGGLKFRMAAVASTLVAGVAIAGALLFSEVASTQLTRQFESTMGSLATNLARNAAHGVFIESGEVLRDLADHLMAEPDVRQVSILNARGERILASQPKPDASTPPALLGEVVAPVVYDAAAEHRVSDEFAPFVPPPAGGNDGSRVIGQVKVAYSRARLAGEIRRVSTRVWGAAALAALGGSLLAIWFADRMIRPLQELDRATARVASGDLGTRVTEAGDDEIASLARSFNRMTEALRASRRQLEDTFGELARKERLATLGQFTAVIAHELRNPLGVILSSAQVISNPKRTPEMKERAATFIVEEVRRLNEDLTAFLNFARPKPPDTRPVDLAEVARRAVEAFRNTPGSGAAPAERTPGSHPNAEPEGRILATVHAESDRPLAQADRDQIHQVLLNLLLNAAQAMQQAAAETGSPAEPPRGHISIRIREESGKCALIVEDDGPGMPDDVRAHVFEPFYTTKKRGSGLGLAVVEQVVRSHDGTLVLDSAPGRGTRFTLLLPAAAPPVPAGATGATPDRKSAP